MFEPPKPKLLDSFLKEAEEPLRGAVSRVSEMLLHPHNSHPSKANSPLEGCGAP